MRQAVFVVVMVAAAFLGGAAVNGPGVRWVQARLLEYLGVKEGEIASVDLPEAPAETADSRDPGAPATAGGPTANPPSVTPRGTPGKGDATRAPGPGPEPADVSSADRTRSRPARTGTPAGKSATESGTATPSGVGNMLGSLLGFKGEDGAGQAARSAGAKDLKKRDSGAPSSPPSPASRTDNPSRPIRRTGASTEVAARSAPEAAAKSGPAGSPGLGPPLESGPGRAGAADPVAGASSGPPPAPLDPTVAPAILASLSPSDAPRHADNDRVGPEAIALEVAPSAAGSPPPAGTGPGAQASPGADAAGWTALRRKLQAAGVTRYTIEGEPGGRVVFSCLIPLAGRQAVSQRFEAEGDDEFQAAQAAIRRIALWRATRQGSAPSR